LIRVAIGAFRLGDLQAGKWREIHLDECPLLLGSPV
jgi:16S rRNA U516 pseudouridylate synthase RsuA-like enzyme